MFRKTAQWTSILFLSFLANVSLSHADDELTMVPTHFGGTQEQVVAVEKGNIGPSSVLLVSQTPRDSAIQGSGQLYFYVKTLNSPGQLIARTKKPSVTLDMHPGEFLLGARLKNGAPTEIITIENGAIFLRVYSGANDPFLLYRRRPLGQISLHTGERILSYQYQPDRGQILFYLIDSQNNIEVVTASASEPPFRVSSNAKASYPLKITLRPGETILGIRGGTVYSIQNREVFLRILGNPDYVSRGNLGKVNLAEGEQIMAFQSNSEVLDQIVTAQVGSVGETIVLQITSKDSTEGGVSDVMGRIEVSPKFRQNVCRGALAGRMGATF